jgi:hypothetical protein
VDVAAYVALSLISALTLGWTLLAPSRKKRIDHALAARPRTFIKLAEGAVKVTGRVQKDHELLEAPLSGRPCVIYELIVTAPTPSAGKGPIWKRLVDVQQGCPFFVVDESGAARIDTSGPFSVALAHDRIGVTKGPYPGAHRPLSLLLESGGIKAKTWLGRWSPIHYSEGALEPGVLVSVAGLGTRDVDQFGEVDNFRSIPRRLTMRGTELQPLLIGDVHEEGEPSPRG